MPDCRDVLTVSIWLGRLVFEIQVNKPVMKTWGELKEFTVD